MSTAKFNTWQNPDGTENYKCRAWVNFNGTGTVAIRAAGNVGSITDNGVGDYTVNFTAALPDVNYAVTYTGDATTSVICSMQSSTPNTTTTARVRAYNTAFAPTDGSVINVAVFR